MIVDVHAHHFPLELPDLAAMTGDPRWPRAVDDGGGRGRIVRGDTTFRPVSTSCWDAARRVIDLDGAGVDRQVISPVPVTLCDWAEPDLATVFLAAQNDEISAATHESGGRLLGLGAVPLQDVDAAIAEMTRCIDSLGLAGIEIGTTVAGRELDDVALRPFFRAAAEGRVPLFVHPSDSGGAIRRQGQPYEFGIGMLTDTALAASALLFGGVLDDVGDLRIAFAHGCGSLPWTYPRTRLFASFLGTDVDAADADLQSFFVDALVFEPEHLRLLVQRFGAEHVMLGSDHPFIPDGLAGARATIDDAVEIGAFTADAAAAALGENALTFLHQPPGSRTP